MFGDGSDGPLNVTSGTTNLALDTKHQFTTVNIDTGAILSTTDTTGSVLYISATESITIDGNIDLRNKVSRGQNSWFVTIDSRTYTSPSTQNGGSGGGGAGASNGGSQGSGFGGGGAGGATTPSGVQDRGGHGGAGGPSSGSGGASRTTTGAGNAGGASSGGGGAALILSGSTTSGAGGFAYGNNGGNAITSNHETASSGGGGGAGGMAGHPGVHVVLVSPSIIINGNIYTGGGDGQNGGSGGSGTSTYATAGSGGGGGGAGNGGSVYIFTKRSGFEDNGTYNMLGGYVGLPGTGYQSGGFGGAGTHGTLTHVEIVTPTLPVRVYDGSEWVFAIAHSRVSGQWERSAVRERG